MTVPTTGETRTSAPALGPRARAEREKLASYTAQRILADVADRGWPVGEVLGSEPDLLARYGVSRAVFREAVRIVEHQEVARMRRGPGGGLVVDSPSPTVVTDAVVIYLFYVGARLDDVFETRLILERAATELVPERLTDDDVAALRALAGAETAGAHPDPRHLHALLAAQSKNPALELFVEILNHVTELFMLDTALFTARDGRHSFDAHVKIIDAVLSGDSGLAGHRMHRHLLAEAEYIRKRRMSRQALGPDEAVGSADGAKRAEAISRAIFRDVVARGWPVGDPLGSETELMQQFDASRAVFREAVRLLEHHQIATMRRGRGGGLFVAEPGVETVADTAAIYLERARITAADLAESRIIVELAVTGLATERIDDGGRGRLADTLEAEARSHETVGFTEAAHDLHATLAALTGNPVLELVARVMIRLTELHQTAGDRDPEGVREMPEHVMRAHRRIVDAVVAGDVDLARTRMRRHLAALASWLE